MDQQQNSGPPVTWPTTEMFSERDTLSPLQQECIPMPVNKSPITKHAPNVSFKDAACATPPLEGVAGRKRPQTTWRRRSPLCTITTFQETNNLFPKEMKNAMTPRVQKVPIITKITTLLLIQNYYCHLPKSHVPRNQPEILINVHIPDTSWDTSAQFQEGPKYSTLKRMGKLNWDCCPTIRRQGNWCTIKTKGMV